MKTYKGSKGKKDAPMMLPEVLEVITDPTHPQYDPRVERPVDEALVESIIAYGVLTPLLCRGEGDKLVVIDGRQRRAAAIEANKRLKKLGAELVRVPCLLRSDGKTNDAKLMAISITANELRSGDSQLDRAKKMQRLVDLGYTDEEVGVAFGVSRQAAKTTMSLLDCTKKVQRAVEGGRMSLTAANLASKLPREEQDAMVDAGFAEQSGPKVEVKVREKNADAAPKRLRKRALLERWLAELSEATIHERTARAVLLVVLGAGGEKLTHHDLLLALQKAERKGKAVAETEAEDDAA